MTGKARALPTSWRAADLVRSFARVWARSAGAALPPRVRAHLRAAAREGLLAVVALGEECLQGAQEQTRRARRRVERIPVEGAASRLKARGRRRR